MSEGVGMINFCCPSCGELYENVPVQIHKVELDDIIIGNETLVVTLQQPRVRHLCKG